MLAGAGAVSGGVYAWAAGMKTRWFREDETDEDLVASTLVILVCLLLIAWAWW